MTLALVRAGLRSRLMLIAVIIFVCGFMRAAHVLGEDQGDWSDGDMHDVATIVVLGLVVPTFTLMLGATLLRGEHGPWSWALARPVARGRVLAVLVVLDVATLAACVATMALLFGGLGHVSYSADQREIIHAALPVVYALLYLAAAIGGARGMGSLRAGLFALVWLAALVGLARVVLFSMAWIHPRLDDVERAATVFEWLLTPELRVDGALAITIAGTGLMSIVLLLIGVIIPAVRAAASVPQPAKWRVLLIPPLVAFLVCGAVAIALAGFARTRFVGPDERGDAEVSVTVAHVETHGRSVILRAPGLPMWQEFASETPLHPPADGRETWRFVDVPAGSWQACVKFLVAMPNPRPTVTHPFVNCVQIEVPDDGSVAVEIEADPRTAVPQWP